MTQQDHLTGLYNRNWLYSQGEPLIQEGEASLIFLDLDNFKSVNDLYGHEAGDRVLQCAAQAMRESVPEGYPIRLGGDEFAILLPGPEDRSLIESVYAMLSEKLLSAADRLPGISLISVSAGVVRPKQGSRVDDVLRLADAALYEAKDSGKRQCVFFSDMEDQYLRERQIAEEAPLAMEKGLFQMRFMPLRNPQNGMLLMTQTLVTWPLSTGAVMHPWDYRPVLEKNGFIHTLDLYLLDRFLALLREKDYNAGRKKACRFSIDLSWISFIDRVLEQKLLDARAQGLPLEELDIMVNERALHVRNVDRMLDGMRRIADLGVTLSLRNFGANYGTMRFLHQAPISTFVFDPEWFAESLTAPQGRKVLRSMVQMGKELHRNVVIPTALHPDDADLLVDWGCDALIGSGKDFYDPDEYQRVWRSFLPGSQPRIYRFLNAFTEEETGEAAVAVGGGIRFAKGISDLWGSLSFPGGAPGENLVELPAVHLSSGSYTLATWMKLEQESEWVVLFFGQFDNGTLSYLPISAAERGISIFRVAPDQEAAIEASGRQPLLHAWNHVCLAYDASTRILRCFLDGRKYTTVRDVPAPRGDLRLILGGGSAHPGFKGYLSSFRIYDYALSDRETHLLFHSYLTEPGFAGELNTHLNDAEI